MPSCGAPQAVPGGRAGRTDTTGGRPSRTLVMSPLSLTPVSTAGTDVQARGAWPVTSTHAGGSVGHSRSDASGALRATLAGTIRDVRPRFAAEGSRTA